MNKRNDVLNTENKSQWAHLNDRVHKVRHGCVEIRVAELGVEENLWSQEALVPHVDFELLLADAVSPGVLRATGKQETG